MTTPIVLVATLTPEPGHEADVIRVLGEVVPQVHAEDGCELYAVQ